MELALLTLHSNSFHTPIQVNSGQAEMSGMAMGKATMYYVLVMCGSEIYI